MESPIEKVQRAREEFIAYWNGSSTVTAPDLTRDNWLVRFGEFQALLEEALTDGGVTVNDPGGLPIPPIE